MRCSWLPGCKDGVEIQAEVGSVGGGGIDDRIVGGGFLAGEEFHQEGGAG